MTNTINNKYWLTSEVEKMVRTNDRLMLKVSEMNNIRVASVERWLNVKSEAITTIANLELIRAELGFLEVNELIEKIESVKQTA